MSIFDTNTLLSGCTTYFGAANRELQYSNFKQSETHLFEHCRVSHNNMGRQKHVADMLLFIWGAVCNFDSSMLTPRPAPYTCETFGVRWEDVKFTAKEEDSDEEVR